MVITLVLVGVLWLLFDGFVLAYAGVNFFSAVTFVCVAAALVAVPLRSYPRLMSVLLSLAAAGVVLIAGFSLGTTTNVGSSGVCSDDFANAVARVPDRYWTWWILVGALTGIAMTAGAWLTPRAIGAGLLGVGGWALAVGTFLLWVFLSDEMKGAPGACANVGVGEATVLAAPVALLALAAVIPGIWSKPSTNQTTSHPRPPTEECPDEEALSRW